jgi:hypothetical protein
MLYQLSYVRVHFNDSVMRMKRAIPLLLVALLATACGGHKQSKADRAAMNAEFAKIDFRIAQWTMGPGYAYNNNLEQLTRRYVAATRKYHDDLGDKEVKRRLTTEASQLAPWCLRCVDILRSEVETR